MARIWYSVCGEGMGHAVRSAVVINFLKEHEIMISAYGKAYYYLKKKFGQKVTKIYGHNYIYRNNAVSRLRTVLWFFLILPVVIMYNVLKLVPLVYRFKPDLIISDFESASHYFARILNIPCINIDNIHAQTECVTKYNSFYLVPMIRCLHPKVNFSLITHFATIKPKNRTTYVIPPILRDKIYKIKSTREDHVLVYQTSSTNKKMIPILKKSNNKFIIYGMNQESRCGNLIFKKFSESFIQDLKNAKFVIVNGGFSVITEALYLQKPILSIPVIHQGEQQFNAIFLQKEGYGVSVTKLTTANLRKFETNLSYYKKNMKKTKKWSNLLLKQYLSKLIKEYT